MSIDNRNLKRIASIERNIELLGYSVTAISDNLEEFIRLYEKFVQGIRNETGTSTYPPYFIRVNANTISDHDFCDICGMSNPIENSSGIVCEEAECLYGNSIARAQK